MVERCLLDNGLTLLIDEENFFRSFNIGFCVRVGSAYENSHNNGYSHFLEHMLFKGTKKRRYLDISREIEEVGGYMNAFTDREYTCYYVQVLSPHWHRAVDVLSDMLFSSVIEDEELQKEKKVVLEEIKMIEDNPEEWVYDLFMTEYYQGESLGFPIIGPASNIAESSREKIWDFYTHFYSPHNLIVSVSGRIEDKKALIRELENLKVNFSFSESFPSLSSFPFHLHQSFHSKPLSQVHFVLGFPTVTRLDSRRYTLQILSKILGEGSSSRLFVQLREKEGLLYSISSFCTFFDSSGIFIVSGSTSLENYTRVLESITEELYRLCQEGVTQEELNRAKEQTKSQILLVQESSEARMTKMAASEIFYGKHFSFEELSRELDQIRIDTVQEEIQELFRSLNSSKYSLFSLGETGHFRNLNTSLPSSSLSSV